MKIVVTDRDIRLGVRGSTAACPIARAARRLTKDRSLRCGKDWIYGGSVHPVSIELPIKARLFVRAFDDGKVVKPFSFSVRKLLRT